MITKKTGSKISLIIATKYASPLLDLCLRSAKENSIYEDNEIIVVPDNPTSKTIQVLEYFKQRYYCVSTGNLFMNYNYGAKKATKEYLSFINDDVAFGPRWDIAIMSLMRRPNIMGSLPRLEPNTGYNFGYSDKLGWKSFDYKSFCDFITENWSSDIHHQHGFPTVIRKKDFWRVGGFTYHTGHAHGHELQMQRRLKEILKINALMTMQSGIFHFGQASNIDNQLDLWKECITLEEMGKKNEFSFPCELKINGRAERFYDYRTGLLVCKRCNIHKQGFDSDEKAFEAETIKIRGSWYCEKCRGKYWLIEKHV